MKKTLIFLAIFTSFHLKASYEVNHLKETIELELGRCYVNILRIDCDEQRFYNEGQIDAYLKILNHLHILSNPTSSKH